MDRQQILDLYDWAPGVCFRHRERGVVDTTAVKTLHLPGGGDREVRACRDCIVAMEAVRREAALLAGGEYLPGHAGEVVQ